MRSLLIESHYLPSISWFSLASQFDEIVIEAHEHFSRQTFRNRCMILGPNGVQSMVVPVSGAHGKTKTCDVKIDNRQRWRDIHWRSLEAAYRKAPYFTHYADELRRVLFAMEESLLSMNYALLRMSLRWLGLELPVSFTSTYQVTPSSDVLDFRDMMHPKRNAGTETWFKARAYTQVFGEDFKVNLSILDLIFCAGPEAAGIVSASARELRRAERR